MNGTKVMNQQEVLRGNFDIATHKEFFTNYLEVVILKNGKIEYAVPSHNEKMTKIYMDQYNLTSRKEVMDRIPREYYGAVVEWLNIQTGAICVWYDGFMGHANKKQLAVLRKLKLHGLYKGSVVNYPTNLYCLP